jgi:hypothetical protein
MAQNNTGEKFFSQLTDDLNQLNILISSILKKRDLPAIERDLVLEKLRGMYHLLLTEPVKVDTVQVVAPEPVVDAVKEEEKVIAEAPASTPIIEVVKDEEPPIVPIQVEYQEIPVVEMPAKAVVEQPKSVEKEVEKAPEQPKKPVSQTNQVETPHTLADTFHSSPALNDTLAKAKGDLASSLKARPLASIESGVGINDKFLIIRELFNGNQAEYLNAIQTADKAAGEAEALEVLAHFGVSNFESEAGQCLVNLVHRRFL